MKLKGFELTSFVRFGQFMHEFGGSDLVGRMAIFLALAARGSAVGSVDFGVCALDDERHANPTEY